VGLWRIAGTGWHRFPLERVGRETVSCGVVEEFESSRVQSKRIVAFG
jgi:hypothetical protein